MTFKNWLILTIVGAAIFAAGFIMLVKAVGWTGAAGVVLVVFSGTLSNPIPKK